MVDLNVMDAAGAYGKLLGQDGPQTLSGETGGAGFQNVLTDAIGEVRSASENAEMATMQNVAGKGDLIDVVTAVNNAEMVVESVVAVRDRVIQAYNDIIRMPM